MSRQDHLLCRRQRLASAEGSQEEVGRTAGGVGGVVPSAGDEDVVEAIAIHIAQGKETMDIFKEGFDG